MNKAAESGQRLQPPPAPGECEILRYGATAEDLACAMQAVRASAERRQQSVC